MKLRNCLTLICLVALLSLGSQRSRAQTPDIFYDVTGGTLSSSASFTGSFQINSATEIIDGGTFTIGGNVFLFSTNANMPGLAYFTDAQGDTFRLALNGAVTALAFNTLLSNGAAGDTALIAATGAQFYLTGGIIALSPPPPPPLPPTASVVTISSIVQPAPIPGATGNTTYFILGDFPSTLSPTTMSSSWTGNQMTLTVDGVVRICTYVPTYDNAKAVFTWSCTVPVV